MSEEARLERVEAKEAVAASAAVDAHTLMTAGQRRVNLIWEFTQAIISIAVVATSMVLAATRSEKDIPSYVSNTLFLVVGFYFSRTNHSSVGGVGRKAMGPYTGR
jgi:hypothetical protein